MYTVFKIKHIHNFSVFKIVYKFVKSSPEVPKYKYKMSRNIGLLTSTFTICSAYI